MATVYNRYKSKPLECWDKAKELRTQHYEDIVSAKDKGKLLVSGCSATCLALPAGLGDYVYFGGEPYGATVSMDTPFCIECMDAAEARGVDRHMCNYMRNYLGSMFLDRFQLGGGFPKPDFIFTRSFCDAGHAKWYRIVSEHAGIPAYAYDRSAGYDMSDNLEHELNQLAGQLYDGIEWMEKVTGRTYDDEKFVQALRNFFLSEVLWGEISLLNSAVPAPLELKTLLSLLPVSMLRRHEDCAVEFMKLLRDEVKDRIAGGIAAVPTERFRLVTDVSPPWYFLKILRYVEGYGTVFVGTRDHTVTCGHVSLSEDGTPAPARTPDELGWPLNSREDAVKAVARWTIESPLHQLARSRQRGDAMLLGLARHLGANGIVLHINDGCVSGVTGLPDTAHCLRQAGYPVMTYEAKFSDCRDFGESEVLDQLDSFLQAQGIGRLA